MGKNKRVFRQIFTARTSLSSWKTQQKKNTFIEDNILRKGAKANIVQLRGNEENLISVSKKEEGSAA